MDLMAFLKQAYRQRRKGQTFEEFWRDVNDAGADLQGQVSAAAQALKWAKTVRTPELTDFQVAAMESPTVSEVLDTDGAAAMAVRLNQVAEYRAALDVHAQHIRKELAAGLPKARKALEASSIWLNDFHRTLDEVLFQDFNRFVTVTFLAPFCDIPRDRAFPVYDRYRNALGYTEEELKAIDYVLNLEKVQSKATPSQAFGYTIDRVIRSLDQLPGTIQEMERRFQERAKLHDERRNKAKLGLAIPETPDEIRLFEKAKADRETYLRGVAEAEALFGHPPYGDNGGPPTPEEVLADYWGTPEASVDGQGNLVKPNKDR